MVQTVDDTTAVDSGQDAAAGMVTLEQAARPREEINMLLMGFGVGLLVGFFFLVYVVIAFTGLNA